MFYASAVLASLMGASTRTTFGFVTPGLAGFFHSIELVTMVVGRWHGVDLRLRSSVRRCSTMLPQLLSTFEGWETSSSSGSILMLTMIFLPRASCPRCAWKLGEGGEVMLEVDNLPKTFGGVEAVQDVSFTIREDHPFESSARTARARRRCSTWITASTNPAKAIVLDGENVAGASPDNWRDAESAARSRICRCAWTSAPLKMHDVGAPRAQRQPFAGMIPAAQACAKRTRRAATKPTG